ncbi:hypothetical protein CYMTET_17068 [Cymbomonas tetramitiformis]|uniref:BED-type domain-containing protein n=1 Tax=Cymbomonas tetramitiformis TaxID=36881 RepID=A0AAE0L7L8_9CHLO|nr:hypothetical protein CYMTET_17068 [Cymbomonas tetramitiformis]
MVCVFDVFADDEDESGFKKPPDNFRSPFWKHYKVKMDGKKVIEYKCLLCGPEVAAKCFCGNTSNLRTHLAHCHKDALVDIKAVQLCEDTAADASSASQCKKGSIDAMLPQPSAAQRDRLHKKISLWLVRRGRPLYLPEKDEEFRDIFREIFKGGYVPPSYQIVIDQVLALSADGRAKVKAALAELKAEGILPSIGGEGPTPSVWL